MTKEKSFKGYTKENSNSTGQLYRNPIHLEEARSAMDQTELVAMANDAKRNISFKRRITKIDYNEHNPRRPTLCPGVQKLKKLTWEDEEEVTDIINTVLRLRPRTVRIHIILSDVEEKKKVTTKTHRKIENLSKPRSTKELASLLSEVFMDKRNPIVEMSFRIVDGSYTEGTFRAELETWATSQEEYEDTEKDHAFLEVEYFGTM